MKALVISAIVLVAVVMGFGVVASAIPLAHAEHPCPEVGREGHTCVPQGRPSCDDIAEAMRDRGVPEQAIQKFLDHCVD